LEKTTLDELFEKVNSLEINNRDDARTLQNIATDAFIALERIQKLILYKDLDQMEDVAKNFWKAIEKHTKK